MCHLVLNWDGSHLGNFDKNVMIKSEKIKNLKFMIIMIPSEQNLIIPCRYIEAKNKFPAIVDEMKKIFGLEKNGTHTINIENKLYVLYKTKYFLIGNNTYKFYEDKSLCKFDRKDPVIFNLANDIKKMIIFRELLSLTFRIGVSIVVDPETKKIKSINEVETYANTESTNRCIITKGIALKWFYDDDIPFYVKFITGNYLVDESCYEDINVTTSRLKNQISDVIEKIDRDYLWFTSYVVNRCLNYLNQ